MKAILNVKKTNQYSKYNGQSFQIKDMLNVKEKKVYGLLGVDPQYPNNQTDFLEHEVILTK